MTDLEEQASAFASENYGDYFDCACGDYKSAWCAAYEAFIHGEVEE